MAIYSRLDLSRDGGIIDVHNQVRQNDCAVLCIGLGGTGSDCLRTIKSQVYNRIVPDNSTVENPYPNVPEYSHIKFLAIDTDTYSFNRDNSSCADFSKLNFQEFFDISSIGSIRDAVGVRQIRRNVLIRNSAAFVGKIKDMIIKATIGLNRPNRYIPNVYIHIFTGMSGGTGSDIFLDVCYLTRRAIREIGVDGLIAGYLFLPEVIIAKGLPLHVASNVKGNGYASLTELDYCMNFRNNGDSWKQEYPGVGVIDTTDKPVDLCYLVSAKDAVGNAISDGYNNAIYVVTECIMEELVTRIPNYYYSPPMVATADTMATRVANNPIPKVGGAAYEYSVIGVATATVPYKQILTYLASGMFDKMKNLIDTLPTENNVDQFVKQNQLQFDDIKKKLSNKCSVSFSAPDLRWRDVKGNTKILIDNLEEQFAQYKNVLHTNLSALSRDIDSYVVVNNNANGVESLISFINEKLQDLAADPEFGPFYAAALLQTTGKDLLAKVSALRMEAMERYDHASYNLNRYGGYYQLYQKADDEFNLNSNLVTGSSKYKEYVAAAINAYKSKAEIELYACMIKLLKKLDEQIHDLSAKFLLPFRDVIKNLYNTFDENSHYIEGVMDGSIVVHNYEMPIVTLSEMKTQMDQTLLNMDVKQKFSELIKSLLSEEGVVACTSGVENSVCVVVNRYFTALFHDYSQMTITKYLEKKFQMTDGPLIHMIETEILDRLYVNANPMFWVSNSYDIGNASALGYATYPQTSYEIQQAVTQLSGDHNGEIAPGFSNVVDRISILRCRVGVPAFGYQGIN